MSTRVSVGAPAPEIGLPDFAGQLVRLADFLGEKAVLLVFNRGFS